MNVSLRQLRLFESVARHLSFTRAANEMHLTQPAVSIQIRQLEENVGMPLFEQIGKRIYLTEMGSVLQATCRTILGELDRFEMEVADRQGLKQGQLRLGVTTTAKYFVPAVLGVFCQQYPGVEILLKVSNQQALLERLARNEDDLYILGRPPQELSVTAIPFMDNPLVMLAHPAHPMAGEQCIPPERFAEEWFLMREPGSGTRDATEKFFDQYGFRLKERLTLGSNEAIKQAVMAQLGVAVLSRSTVGLETEVGRLVMLDVHGFPIPRQWYIVYPADKRLSVVADTFCQSLQDQVAPEQVHQEDS